MFTERAKLCRLIMFAFTISLLTFSNLLVYAQQQQGIGTLTKPNTIVYKLKEQAQNARVSEAPLKEAFLKIGAKAARQKFPEVPAMSNARRSSSPEISRIYELTYSKDIPFEKVRNAIMATGMVEYVEPLYERKPFHQPNDPASDSTKTTQFYLKLISAYEAWSVERGDTNVVVGILDTGFRLNHQDLVRKVKRNYNDPVDGIDNDGDGYVDNFEGWDFGDNDNNVFDDTQYAGHGTSVAAVASAAADNGVGLAGVGFNIKFLPLKVFNSTSSGGFGGYDAIVYAANMGCSVINLSWGGEGYSQYEQDIINYAVLEKNVVVVASGGNSAGNIDFYPASYANVLSVGGTDSKDIKYSSYTHSYNIDIAAPSRSIYTALFTNETAYGSGNGTSFASPIVAAAAALVKSKYPELNARQVMERLRVSTDNIYNLTGNQPYLEMIGKGRLNIKKALKQQNLKSARCTEFKVTGKYVPTAGESANIIASFVNFLAPTNNLTITLTSTSPYISIPKSTFSPGALGTMANAGTGSQPTFTFEVAENAPAQLNVAFRLGFKDGEYEDYQYFTMKINPDYLTLDANNLKVTLNSKGNLGYNGFKFNEGHGVVYKNNSPMLFEGGLMLATSETTVSDNLRSKMWENDNDFVPTSITKRHLNTPLATQEIRNVMHDNHNTPNEPNIGVKVKQVSYGWSTPGNEDFVVLEYHITNTKADTVKNLRAGLFADWDIGEYYLNTANWDEETQVGYVKHVSSPLPFAGVKLLSGNQPSYYAIDNIGATNDDLVIEDNFTSAEKYKTLSNGIARKSAGGKTGNNVSHVIGETVKYLAPGETKIVAFALMAGDNLTQLKSTALAAQQKYNSFRTSPVPLAMADTACVGTVITWAPQGGTKFNFYADSEKTQLLKSGSSYTIEDFQAQTAVYAASTDSLFESAAIVGSFSLPKTPVADFELEQLQVFAGEPVTFLNKSKDAVNWRWDFGTVQPFTDKDMSYTFEQPGKYEVKLTVSDRYACSDVSVIKTIEVLAATPTGISNAFQNAVKLYPNPTTGILYLKAEDLSITNGIMPEVTVTDMVGKNYTIQVSGNAGTAVTDLSDLSAGVYLAHIKYESRSIVKRIVVMKP